MPDEKRRRDVEVSPDQDEVDPLGQCRLRVQKVLGVAAGEAGIVAALQAPSIGEAGGEHVVVGRRIALSRHAAHPGSRVQVAEQHHPQVGVGGAREDLLPLRDLSER